MALIAATAILAVAAAPASALKWVGGSTWSGSLTFTKEGGKSPSKCTFSKRTLFIGVSEPLALENELFQGGGWSTSGACSEGGAAKMYPRLVYAGEISAGKYKFRFTDTLIEGHQSPWSGQEWWGDESGEGIVTFINENATEPSRLVFSNTYTEFVEGFPFQALASGTLIADGKQKLE